MRKKKRNIKLAFAANMPPLYHVIPGEKYSQKKSEVLKWLSERLAMIEYLFDQASNAHEIIYDPKTSKWQGVDYEN